MQLHNLGFPRIGHNRELKKAVESYWKGDIDQPTLEKTGAELRKKHWQIQHEAGLDLLPVGDFSWYDTTLDTSCLLGAVPKRFNFSSDQVDLDTLFRMARGRAPSGEPAAACEMTKWFDTNYHYIVPELDKDQNFSLSSSKLFDEVAEAQALGYRVKPVILGPLSWLWLGKCRSEDFNKLDLLDRLLPVYQQILEKLSAQGVEWVQIDEPILVLDLPEDWKQAFKKVYEQLSQSKINILLATYFGALQDNLQIACDLPVVGLHIDAVRAPAQLIPVIEALGDEKILSAGVIDGRNIWKTDLNKWLVDLKQPLQQLGERLWLAPSCSLLHTPVDLDSEDQLDAELKNWLAFAVQKLHELKLLGDALQGRDVTKALEDNQQAITSRQTSSRIHVDAVKQRVKDITEAMVNRNSEFALRKKAQQAQLNLPAYPTTTIGSFPQTTEIRQLRLQFKQGKISSEEYKARMREEIAFAIKKQEELGLDVLVHGEPERNDMVEYFGEQLNGFAFTRNGWVQSYGSRCVKPPIIYGDVSRPHAMTVAWSEYAQSLTDKPVKGMLTGPVTILQWSFVRDDQSRSETCTQIALAIRDEVLDLEDAGIKLIQIDEPAIREGLPLRQSDWQEYLDWAVRAFRISAAGVADKTQIHTHMCYAEFNDIMPAIANMDADVITIETSRSAMELLDAFEDFNYPNDIGPGVYDIHSPNIPDTQAMESLMQKAASRIPAEQLWVNPDCGLKTRNWPEVEQALANMVETARSLRQAQTA